MKQSHAVIAVIAASLMILGTGIGMAVPRPAGMKDGPTIWVDSLDLTKAVGGGRGGPRPGQAMLGGRGGGGGAGGRAGATPPAPTPITLDGTVYTKGLGVTSGTEFWIDLKGGASRFAAQVGIDDARKTGKGTVAFEVWLDGKKKFDSGIIKSGDKPKPVSVDLSKAKTMILYVSDAADGTTDDIADWANAGITMAKDDGVRPVAIAPIEGPTPAIAASRTAAPRINQPRITGATPGRPFLFRIPASGEGPLTYSVKNLPAGLKLDTQTGIITGALATEGRTPVSVTVTGPKGTTTATITIVGGQHSLALTPPLGWNSWNIWAASVDDAKVRAAADALVNSGLAAQGYTYVNIDDVWEARTRAPNGEIMSNDKFPDMKALADYVHSKGLKIGIYSGPGTGTCQRYPASLGHEKQDAETWAKWGFDYIKYDWCTYPGNASVGLDSLKVPYVLMRKVLDGLDRDMVFSLCQYGWGKVWEWGQSVGGNLWRVTGDITDTWASMSGIGFAQTGHEKYAGPGHWNDTDMLVVGKVGWGSTPRDTKLTPNEQITHISLWTLQAAPLIIGADFSQIDAFTTNLLGNPEVLAVNQDVLGQAAGRTTQNGRVEVWSRPLADGTIAVGLFNRDIVSEDIEVKWSDLGITGSQPIRDLWLQKDLKPANGSFKATVPRHGAVLVKIGKPKPQS